MTDFDVLMALDTFVKARLPGDVVARRLDGSDVSAELTDRIEAAYDNGGGHIILAPGVHTVSTTVDVPDTVWISGPAAKVHNDFDGYTFRCKTRAGHGGYSPGPQLDDIWFTGTPAARGAILTEDTNQVRVRRCKFTGFAGEGPLDLTADGITGCPIHIRNPDPAPTWSEGFRVYDCNFASNRHVLITSPGTQTGTTSFGRLRLVMCTVAGGIAGQRVPLILLRGGVYDSSVSMIGGNIQPGTVLVGLGAGWMPNTVIDQLQVESIQPGAFVFGDFGGWPGPPPIVGQGVSPPTYMVHASWEGGPRGFTAGTHHNGVSLPHQATWPSNEADRSKLFANVNGAIQYRNESGGPITL